MVRLKSGCGAEASDQFTIGLGIFLVNISPHGPDEVRIGNLGVRLDWTVMSELGID